MTNLLLDSVPSRHLEGRSPPHLGSEIDRPLVTPVEVPLYLFLTYLAFFVYSNVVL